MPNYEADLERGIKLKELRDDAKRLKEEFDQGDKLAPFECCWLWREAGFRDDELPEWVLTHIVSIAIAAEYFSKRPFKMFEADLDNPNLVTPRAFIKMTPRERKKLEPSLDKIAELSGIQGQSSVWLWKAEHDRDPYIASYQGELKKRARDGNNKYVLRIGERAEQAASLPPMKIEVARALDQTKLSDVVRRAIEAGLEPGTDAFKKFICTVPILDDHGRLREEVQNVVARLFKIDRWEPSMGWARNKARTVRRRLKRLKRLEK